MKNCIINIEIRYDTIKLSQYPLSLIYRTALLATQSITMQSTSTTHSTMHCHITTPSTKWFQLACLHYSYLWSVWWLIHSFNYKTWCMLIVWHQNHSGVVFFISPGYILFNTHWASLNCPHSGKEVRAKTINLLSNWSFNPCT